MDFFYKIDRGSHPGLVLHVLCQSYLIELTLIYLVTIELDFTFKLKVDFLFVEFPHRDLEVKAMFDKKQNVESPLAAPWDGSKYGLQNDLQHFYLNVKEFFSSKLRNLTPITNAK